MLNRGIYPLLASIVVIGACQIEPKGTSDTTGEPPSGTDTAAEPTETSPGTDSSATETSATDSSATETSATEGATETSATDSSATETSATEGATETSATEGATETGGAATCPSEGDPATSAGFKVQLDGWPEQSDDDHSIERTCTIDGVSSDGVAVTTSLTCDVDGVPRGASFVIAAAPEGAVDWSAGEVVALRSRAFGDEFGGDVALRVTPADDPEALLVDGQDWWGDNVPGSQTIGPILREIASTCELGDFPGEEIGFELTYSLASGASVDIHSGHRGALAIDATHVYAIDLAGSGEDCCHGSEHSLIRRVKLD